VACLEAKEILAKATALEAYAKQANNFEAERKCGEVRLRAAVRGGELLKELKKNGTMATQEEGHLCGYRP